MTLCLYWCYFFLLSRETNGLDLSFDHQELRIHTSPVFYPVILTADSHLPHRVSFSTSWRAAVWLYKSTNPQPDCHPLKRSKTNGSNYDSVCIKLQPELPRFRPSVTWSQEFQMIYLFTPLSSGHRVSALKLWFVGLTIYAFLTPCPDKLVQSLFHFAGVLRHSRIQLYHRTSEVYCIF